MESTAVLIESNEREIHDFEWLTVERTIYAALILIAVAVRFFEIGKLPLHSIEATNVWPAWQAVTDGRVAGTSMAGSALLYSMHVALFSLVGDGDVIARLAPALLGALMTLLPWWWRLFVGRYAALFLSLLIAIDPWLVHFSRMADGAIASTFCAMLVLTCLMNLVVMTQGKSDDGTDESEVEQDRPIRLRYRWNAIAAVGLGLLLVSGTMAWSFFVVLGLFLVIYYSTLKETIVWRMSLLAWFGGAVILGSTAWLASPEGLGLVSASLDTWLAGFFPSASQGPAVGVDYAFAWPWLHLVTVQPLLVVASIGGLGYLAVNAYGGASHTDSRWFRFLILWLLWGVLLSILPGRNPYTLIILVGPLMIGAAHALGELAGMIPTNNNWREAGGLAAALIGTMIATSFWLVALVSNRQFSSQAAQPVLILLTLVVLLVIAYGFWSGWKEAFWLTGIVFASLLLLASVGKSMQLNLQAGTGRPGGIFQEETHPDIIRMASDVETLSAQRTGDPHAMPLQIQTLKTMPGVPGIEAAVAVPDPLLGWYFRDMNRLEWMHSPSVDGETRPSAAVVAFKSMDTDGGGETVTQKLPDDYIGSAYAIRSYWQPADLRNDIPGSEVSREASLWRKISAGLDDRWNQQIQPALRWMIYGEVAEMPRTQEVILWVAEEQ